MKKSGIYAVLLVLPVLFQLTSCGASYDMAKNEMPSEAKASWEAAYDVYYDADIGEFDYSSGTNGGTLGNAVAADGGTSAVNDLAERKIIKSASLSYETRTYDDFLDLLSACIRTYGGYVESGESYGGSSYDTFSTRSAYMTVRIPLDSYNAFMGEAGGLGNLVYQSETSTDVTMSYVDTESRIRSLETEYDALLSILEKADKLEDVLSLQSRITEVTYQLENYKAQLRKYDDLISYCTVSISVTEVERETPNVREMTFGEKIRSGLNETFENIGEDATNFAVWFVTSLPYLILWAVFLTVVLLLLRLLLLRFRKHRKQKKTETAENEQNSLTGNDK